MFGQRIGVGALELGQLPPLQHFLDEAARLVRQLLVGREVIEQPGSGFPLARLGLLAARQLHPVEQDFTKLARGADVELCAGRLLDGILKAPELLGEVARQPRQHLPLDLDAVALHPGEHGRKRAFQCLVNGGALLGGQTRFEQKPQPQGYIGVLGRIFARLVDGDLVEGERGLARAGDILEGDTNVPQMAQREFVHAMTASSRVKRVRKKHGVVQRPQLDAVLGEHEHVVFEVLPDLEDAFVFQHRLEHGERVFQWNLLRIADAFQIEPVARAVLQGNIAGLAGLGCHGYADKPRLHGVE